MKVCIRYFASIREGLGIVSEDFESSAETISDLRDILISRGGNHATFLARGKAVRVALDQVMSDESSQLKNGCEVAFFPPVTGG